MEKKRPVVFIYGLNEEHFIAELIKAAASDDPMYRCLAAAASETPRKLLKELCSDSNPMVRKCAANNAATPRKYAVRAMEETGENAEECTSVVIKFERKKKAYYASLF